MWQSPRASDRKPVTRHSSETTAKGARPARLSAPPLRPGRRAPAFLRLQPLAPHGAARPAGQARARSALGAAGTPALLSRVQGLPQRPVSASRRERGGSERPRVSLETELRVSAGSDLGSARLPRPRPLPCTRTRPVLQVASCDGAGNAAATENTGPGAAPRSRAEPAQPSRAPRGAPAAGHGAQPSGRAGEQSRDRRPRVLRACCPAEPEGAAPAAQKGGSRGFTAPRFPSGRHLLTTRKDGSAAAWWVSPRPLPAA